MKLINNKVYFAVQDYLMILLGTLLYGFGFNAFILSNEIITGRSEEHTSELQSR